MYVCCVVKEQTGIATLLRYPKDRDRAPTASLVERKPLLRTISYNKGSSFGASILCEAGNPCENKK